MLWFSGGSCCFFLPNSLQVLPSYNKGSFNPSSPRHILNQDHELAPWLSVAEQHPAASCEPSPPSTWLLLTVSADGRAGYTGRGRNVVRGGLLGNKSHDRAVRYLGRRQRGRHQQGLLSALGAYLQMQPGEILRAQAWQGADGLVLGPLVRRKGAPGLLKGKGAPHPAEL